MHPIIVSFVKTKPCFSKFFLLNRHTIMNICNQSVFQKIRNTLPDWKDIEVTDTFIIYMQNRVITYMDTGFPSFLEF